ncbi:MAG: glycerophosphoryl diester phosphodiesterase [Rhodospirillales bacterium]|nr:glycerophosphoryl diester phosphodiesterase [Rhodospirillales bacterium]
MSPFVTPVVGHRGAAASAPENTLVSLKTAAEQGARWVEFDVKLTADGTVILLHDDRLERTTDGRGNVSEMTYGEILKADAGRSFSPRFAGERVPTLGQAFALLSQYGLSANIELKPCPGFEAATALAVSQVVKEELADFAGDIVVSSFSEPCLSCFGEAMPGVSLALLFGKTPVDWRARAERVGADAIHCRQQNLTRVQLNGFLAAGYPVRCYTVNDVRTAKRLLGWGVESIFTDHPGKLLGGI